MADSLRSSIIDLGWRINTRELERANAETDAMIHKAMKAEGNFDKTSKSIDNATSALGKNAKGIEKSTDKIVDFGQKSRKSLNDTEKGAKDTTKKMKDVGKEFDDSTESARKFGTRGSKSVKDVGDSANKSRQSIDRLADASEKASGRIKRGFDKAKVAVAALTAVTIAGAKTALNASSDYEESLNKVEAVFDKDAASVKKWSDQTIKGIGLASATALDLSSGYGDMATSMGINSKEAATMSMTMVDLAADLASFKNKDISQINTALNGVFTGEGEALKSLGVIMTQSQLEQYALAKGYQTSGESAAESAKKSLAVEKAQIAVNNATEKHGSDSLEARDAQNKLALAVEKANEASGVSLKNMSQAELVRLRYNYLLDKTTNAQGDFKNNLDSVANSERVFQETSKQTAKVFGDVLSPVYVKMLGFGTDLLEKSTVLPDKFEAMKKRMKPFYEDTVKYLGGVKDYFVDEMIPSAKDLVANMGPGFLDGAKDSLKLVGWTVENVIKPPLEWLKDYSDDHPDKMRDIAKWAGFGITGILGFSIVSGPIFTITKKVNSLRRSIERIGESAIVSAGKAKLGFDTIDKNVPSGVPQTGPAAPVAKTSKFSKAKKGAKWLLTGASAASKTPIGLGAQSIAAETALLKSAGMLSTGGKIAGGVSKVLGGAKGLAKSIPGISYIGAATNLIGTNKDNAGEKVGGSVGTLIGSAVGTKAATVAGAKFGAIAGTTFGPVGTVVGGILGTGIGASAGLFLGSKMGPVVQDSLSGVFDKMDAAGEKMVDVLAKSIRKNKDKIDFAWDALKLVPGVGLFASMTEGLWDVGNYAYELSKGNPLNEEGVSAKDGVSKKTAKAVNRYADENIDVTSKLEYFRVSGEAYTKEDSEEIIKSYDKMQGIVQDHIDSSRKNSQSDFDKLVASGVMSGDTAKQAAQRAEEDWKFRETKQKEYHDNLVKLEKERADKIEKSNKSHEDKINAIKKKALEENRTLTASENDQIALLEKQRQEAQTKIMDEYSAKQTHIQDQAKSNAVMTLSASAKEQMIILGKLSNSSEEISAKQAQGMIQNSYAAKEETVKNAEKQYDETKSILENKLYVTGEITQAEYDEALANAKKMKDDTVAQAIEQHDKVVEQATKRSEGLIRLANLETGESLNAWNTFKIDLQSAVNTVIRGINKPLEFFGIKKIPEWGGSSSAKQSSTSNSYLSDANKNTGGMRPAFYKGDRSSYAGPALVGEEGVELAYNKSNSSMRLLGSNGPEVANVGSSERILSHKETMSVLNGGLGTGLTLPGFDKGKGGKSSDIISNIKEVGSDLWEGMKDFGASAMEWLSDPVGKVKALIDTNNPFKKETSISGFGWGTLTTLGNGAKDWVKGKFDSVLSSFSTGTGAAFGSGAFAPRFGSGFTMTSDFGNRAALFGRSFHNGMDFAAPMGTPLVAQHPGVVSHAGYVNSYGNLVAVNVAKGMHTLYGHMQSIAVKAGQAVGRGGLLGTVGSTGDSTGPHVHYELKKGGVFGQTVDPKTYGQPAKSAGGSPTGYKNGGWITKDGVYRAGEDGDNEIVIPVDHPQRAMELIGQALNYLGVNKKSNARNKALRGISRGESYLSSDTSMSYDRRNIDTINGPSKMAPKIDLSPTFNITIEGGGDSSVEAKVKKAIEQATEELVAQLQSMFPKGAF